MTADNRRIVRTLCTAVLVISLPLAGFAWALPENSSMLAIAGVLTLLSLAVGFGAEYLASSTENELNDFDLRLAADRKRRTVELESHDEKIRQFDRIIGLLTEQNNTLRTKLIAVQVELQRKKDALVEAAEEAVSLDEVAPLRAAYRAH